MDRPFSERKSPQAHDVHGFGTHLKVERQSRGFTLEDVSETTKIRVSYLEALEKEDFSKLPAETFTKGFIRSYCRCIRIDDQEMIRAYSSRVGHDQPPSPDLSGLKPRSPGERVSRIMGSIKRILTGSD